MITCAERQQLILFLLANDLFFLLNPWEIRVRLFSLPVTPITVTNRYREVTYQSAFRSETN